MSDVVSDTALGDPGSGVAVDAGLVLDDLQARLGNAPVNDFEGLKFTRVAELRDPHGSAALLVSRVCGEFLVLLKGMCNSP